MTSWTEAFICSHSDEAGVHLFPGVVLFLAGIHFPNNYEQKKSRTWWCLITNLSSSFLLSHYHSQSRAPSFSSQVAPVFIIFLEVLLFEKTTKNLSLFSFRKRQQKLCHIFFPFWCEPQHSLPFFSQLLPLAMVVRERKSRLSEISDCIVV